MTDPVADKSGFLRMYMSSHPDTLVAYAKWYGKVREPIKSAELTAIDSKSMTLTCTLTSGTKKDVRVALDPPLASYDDVKPRLLEMKAIAQENLGMIKVPRITSFHLPGDTFTTALIVGGLLYLAFCPSDDTSILSAPARLAYHSIGRSPFTYVFYTVAVTHVFEGIYTYTLCRTHKTGFLLGAAHVFATLIFGFPIWKDLRKRIQAARIDSVMKVE